jgi:ABC-type spermidine/putrescine transport system permease subunit II
MNRFIMIHHLRLPVIVLLAGTLALLCQLNVIEHFWHWFIPLLLIFLGVMMLAERAALATMDNDNGNGAWPYGGTPTTPAVRPETSIVPSSHSSTGGQGNGGTQ